MNANLALTQLLPLAKDLDEDKVTPGVLGFIVFAALAIGVYFLMKSMNRHMGRVDFEEEPDADGPAKRSKTKATAGAPAAERSTDRQRPARSEGGGTDGAPGDGKSGDES